jgi:uncharacterized protein (TIGR02118 family)
MSKWPTETGLTALGDDRDAALEAGRKLAESGAASSVWVHVAHEGQDRHYVSVLRAVGRSSDLLDAVAPVGKLGVYESEFRRVKAYERDWEIGQPSRGLGLVFGIWRRPDLDHAAFNAYWRDHHAPLALEVHEGMWDYTQCAFGSKLAGEGDFDGMAICQFETVEDLRERFFPTPDAERRISEDVVKFGDPARLARVAMTEYVLR